MRGLIELEKTNSDEALNNYLNYMNNTKKMYNEISIERAMINN